jgi:hypothetical protein
LSDGATSDEKVTAIAPDDREAALKNGLSPQNLHKTIPKLLFY